MSRPLTATELEELAARLKAGDPQAVSEAIQATKPERVRKVHRKPGLTPEQKRLTKLKREYGQLRTLHASYMEARRAISDARKSGGLGWRDPEMAKHDLFVANNEARLHAQLESFLHELQFHFNDLTNEQP